jgi:hypothetical protein
MFLESMLSDTDVKKRRIASFANFVWLKNWLGRVKYMAKSPKKYPFSNLNISHHR